MKNGEDLEYEQKDLFELIDIERKNLKRYKRLTQKTR